MKKKQKTEKKTEKKRQKSLSLTPAFKKAVEMAREDTGLSFNIVVMKAAWKVLLNDDLYAETFYKQGKRPEIEPPEMGG